MKIYVNDWMGGEQLDGWCLNFKVVRNPELNKGTKKNPNIVPGSITVWVDARNFQ